MSGGIIIFAIIWIADLAMLAYALRGAWNSRRAATWPAAPVTFTTLKIQETDNEGITYKVIVDYSYTVADTIFQSRTLAIGYDGGTDSAEATELLNAIKNATAVHARYSPADPGNAVLTFGMHRGITMKLAFSSMGFCFLVVLLVMGCLMHWFPDSKAVNIAFAIVILGSIGLFSVGTALLVWLNFRKDRTLLSNLKLE